MQGQAEQLQLDYHMGLATQSGVCRKHGNQKHVTFFLASEDGGDNITICIQCVRELEAVG
jgi:hypothetical protein